MNPEPPETFTRRSALRCLTIGGLAMAAPAAAGAKAGEADDELTFFVMADPQIHLDKWGTAGTEKCIRLMNELPGKPFPFGGNVAEPLAVLVAGDLVDVVDDPRHWLAYVRLIDPNGDALLRFRAFECIGNHDLSTNSGDGLSAVQQEFIKRSSSRKGPETFHYDKLNYHYSWNWGPLHLVNLNLFPGNTHRQVYDREAPWNNPLRSLDFLRDDLKNHVGDSGRPVILMWHYGLRGWGLEKWWTPEDLVALKEVIEPYNVVMILHGHEHSFAEYEWEGYPVFMCPSPQRDRDPKSPDVESTLKGFLVIRLQGKHLQLAHHNDGKWADTWRQEISLGKS